MFELLGGVLGSGMLGGFVKHFIPSKKINKFIPLINVLGSGSLYMSQGHGFMESLVGGIMSSLAAKGGHQTVVKETALSEVRVPMARWVGTGHQGL